MKLRILLADDNMAVQNQGRKILTEAGYDVVTVSNGVAAEKKIAELHPDIVLLDVYMPGYTGLEVCEKIKASPATAQTPVGLIVGKMDPFLPGESTKVKADRVIMKPFETGELIATVGRLAQSVHPPESAVPVPVVVPQFGLSTSQSKSTVFEFRMANEAAEAVQALSPPIKSAVAEATACLQPGGKPEPRNGSDSATRGDTRSAYPPHQQGGEICDVCGHVNGEDAFVCQRCDVPLPSTVRSCRIIASKTTTGSRSGRT